MTNKLFFYNKKKQKLCGILEEPNPKKELVVIIIHGSSSNKNARSTLVMAEMLIANGINSFRIDLDGCGESEGDFADQTLTSAVRDLEAAHQLMKSMDYKKIALFGNSRAGPPCMTISLNHPEIYKMALKAPISDYIPIWKKKRGDEWLKEWKEKGYTYKIKTDGTKLRMNYIFCQDAENYYMSTKVKDIEVPTLIIQGDADKSVPIEFTKHLTKNYPAARLVIFEGADHKFLDDVQQKEAYNLIINWFQEEENDNN